MTKACINLKQKFGKKHKISVDESYYAETGNDRLRDVDPWFWQVQCRYGHLFPWGGNRIGVSVDGHPGIARKVARLDCVRVEQDGDRGELTGSFELEDFRKVARVIRPKLRRQLSPEERRRRSEILAKAREERKPGAAGERSGASSTSDTI